MSKRRVFVIGAYIPNGGAFMAYHLARILHLDFGFEGFAVGDGDVGNGILDYDVVFPTISQAAMENVISDHDVLVANPSFSDLCLGWRCAGRKIMYAQGFSTFSLLDCRFDHYTSVSRFVQKFILNTYGVNSTVISPFIRADRFPVAAPWRDRAPDSILVSLKGDSVHQRLVLERLRGLVGARRPDIRLDNVLAEKIPQNELMSRIGRCRYFLTLSPAEGFGLMPLEAMAMGTTVVGFDGFGGRDYMRHDVNCAVTAYPDIEGVAGQLLSLLDNPRRAETLAEAGRATAQQSIYTHDRFRAAWSEQFDKLLFAKQREFPCGVELGHPLA